MDEGKSLIEKYKSPLQKFKDEQEKLNELKKAGAIDEETYNKAMKDSQDTLNKANKTVRSSSTGVDSLVAGSAEAAARGNAFRFGAMQDAEQTAKLAIAQGAPEVAGLSQKANANNKTQIKPVKAMNHGTQSKNDQAKWLEQIATNTKKSADKPPLTFRNANF